MPPSENSIQQYENVFNFLIRKANGSKKLSDIYEVIKNADVKPTTRMHYLNTVIAINNLMPFPASDDKAFAIIVKDRDKLLSSIQETRKIDNYSDRQRAVADSVSQQDILQALANLYEERNNSKADLANYLLLKISSETPLRNDLAKLRITRDRDQVKNLAENWALVTPSKVTLFINRHKTSATNGSIILEMSPDVSRDINRLVQAGASKYLFTNNRNEPYSSSAFTHKMNRLTKEQLGVPFGSLMFRKLYLSDKYGSVTKEMERDAKVMGNSVRAQKEFYIDNA